MNANFFCLDAWICKKELYICYVNNDKQTHNDMTFSSLPFGTTLLYNDQSNTDLRYTVVGQETDQFGSWVECITETGHIELKKAHTVIDGQRWMVA